MSSTCVNCGRPTDRVGFSARCEICRPDKKVEQSKAKPPPKSEKEDLL